ncbi:hypothetical protein BH23GEM3_BH23GEM3_05410 [soil metagenome]|nr:PBP1A family penicillin-binding protein [Gemmatimonadota bacterium]
MRDATTMYTNPHGTPPPRGRRILRGLLGAFLALLFVAVAGWAWVWFAPCSMGGCAPIHDVAQFQAEGSQLLDIDGESFGTLATVNRRVVSLDSLPPHLSQAVLAVEDRRFYKHGGIDMRRMGGAVRATFGALTGRGGRVEGGSTITMQLARNLFPDRLPYTERSPRRKIMEVRIARQLEREFSKDKILELYLNHIYLGSGSYGVEAATQTYFGKPAAELTLAEAALLGGLPRAPSTLDPTRNREGALERRNLVLREMADAGYITVAEAEEARETPIRLASGRNQPSDLEGSYFIERVRRELDEHVGGRFYTAGLRVFTTLDRTAQQSAEEELSQQLTAIEAGRFGSYRHPTYADTKGQSAESGETRYLQGMVVVMDAANGEVRALVGGRDWNDSKFDRAVQSLRQPGSAFKPFVYLAALERYRSPTHQVDDAPVRITLSGNRVWEPRNYGDQYDGMVTLREALTRSKNAATVRLAQEVGIGPAIRTARDLGISSDIPETPATALGSADVRPIELVASYAAFSNGGYRVEPHFIRRIEDRSGRVIWEARPERRQVLNPAAAFVLTSILRDVVDRGTGTAVRGAGFSGPAAGKTGTTNANTDVWFVGYTPELVGGVWIGMDQPETIIRGASGGTLAAPIWGRMMNRIYQTRPMPAAWQAPSGVISEEVERGTGILVSDTCPAQGATYTEYFLGAPPRGICPRGAQYPYFAAGDESWGDEEWDTRVNSSDSLEERGIVWPELDRIREEREGTVPAPAPRERRPVISPPAPRPPADTTPPRPERPTPDTVTRPAPDTVARPTPDTITPPPPDTVTPPPPRERDLPGIPVTSDRARQPGTGAPAVTPPDTSAASAPERGTRR